MSWSTSSAFQGFVVAGSLVVVAPLMVQAQSEVLRMHSNPGRPVFTTTAPGLLSVHGVHASPSRQATTRVLCMCLRTMQVALAALRGYAGVVGSMQVAMSQLHN